VLKIVGAAAGTAIESKGGSPEDAASATVAAVLAAGGSVADAATIGGHELAAAEVQAHTATHQVKIDSALKAAEVVRAHGGSYNDAVKSAMKTAAAEGATKHDQFLIAAEVTTYLMTKNTTLVYSFKDIAIEAKKAAIEAGATGPQAAKEAGRAISTALLLRPTSHPSAPDAAKLAADMVIAAGGTKSIAAWAAGKAAATVVIGSKTSTASAAGKAAAAAAAAAGGTKDEQIAAAGSGAAYFMIGAGSKPHETAVASAQAAYDQGASAKVASSIAAANAGLAVEKNGQGPLAAGMAAAHADESAGGTIKGAAEAAGKAAARDSYDLGGSKKDATKMAAESAAREMILRGASVADVTEAAYKSARAAGGATYDVLLGAGTATMLALMKVNGTVSAIASQVSDTVIKYGGTKVQATDISDTAVQLMGTNEIEAIGAEAATSAIAKGWDAVKVGHHAEQAVLNNGGTRYDAAYAAGEAAAAAVRHVHAPPDQQAEAAGVAAAACIKNAGGSADESIQWAGKVAGKVAWQARGSPEHVAEDAGLAACDASLAVGQNSYQASAHATDAAAQAAVMTSAATKIETASYAGVAAGMCLYESNHKATVINEAKEAGAEATRTSHSLGMGRKSRVRATADAVSILLGMNRSISYMLVARRVAIAAKVAGGTYEELVALGARAAAHAVRAQVKLGDKYGEAHVHKRAVIAAAEAAAELAQTEITSGNVTASMVAAKVAEAVRAAGGSDDQCALFAGDAAGDFVVKHGASPEDAGKAAAAAALTASGGSHSEAVKSAGRAAAKAAIAAGMSAKNVAAAAAKASVAAGGSVEQAAKSAGYAAAQQVMSLHGDVAAVATAAAQAVVAAGGSTLAAALITSDVVVLAEEAHEREHPEDRVSPSEEEKKVGDAVLAALTKIGASSAEKALAKGMAAGEALLDRGLSVISACLEAGKVSFEEWKGVNVGKNLTIPMRAAVDTAVRGAGEHGATPAEAASISGRCVASLVGQKANNLQAAIAAAQGAAMVGLSKGGSTQIAAFDIGKAAGKYVLSSGGTPSEAATAAVAGVRARPDSSTSLEATAAAVAAGTLVMMRVDAGLATAFAGAAFVAHGGSSGSFVATGGKSFADVAGKLLREHRSNRVAVGLAAGFDYANSKRNVGLFGKLGAGAGKAAGAATLAAAGAQTDISSAAAIAAALADQPKVGVPAAAASARSAALAAGASTADALKLAGTGAELASVFQGGDPTAAGKAAAVAVLAAAGSKANAMKAAATTAAAVARALYGDSNKATKAAIAAVMAAGGSANDAAIAAGLSSGAEIDDSVNGNTLSIYSNATTPAEAAKLAAAAAKAAKLSQRELALMAGAAAGDWVIAHGGTPSQAGAAAANATLANGGTVHDAAEAAGLAAARAIMARGGTAAEAGAAAAAAARAAGGSPSDVARVAGTAAGLAIINDPRNGKLTAEELAKLAGAAAAAACKAAGGSLRLITETAAQAAAAAVLARSPNTAAAKRCAKAKPLRNCPETTLLLGAVGAAANLACLAANGSAYDCALLAGKAAAGVAKKLGVSKEDVPVAAGQAAAASIVTGNGDVSIVAAVAGIAATQAGAAAAAGGILAARETAKAMATCLPCKVKVYTNSSAATVRAPGSATAADAGALATTAAVATGCSKREAALAAGVAAGEFQIANSTNGAAGTTKGGQSRLLVDTACTAANQATILAGGLPQDGWKTAGGEATSAARHLEWTSQRTTEAVTKCVRSVGGSRVAVAQAVGAAVADRLLSNGASCEDAIAAAGKAAGRVISDSGGTPAEAGKAAENAARSVVCSRGGKEDALDDADRDRAIQSTAGLAAAATVMAAGDTSPAPGLLGQVRKPLPAEAGAAAAAAALSAGASTEFAAAVAGRGAAEASRSTGQDPHTVAQEAGAAAGAVLVAAASKMSAGFMGLSTTQQEEQAKQSWAAAQAALAASRTAGGDEWDRLEAATAAGAAAGVKTGATAKTAGTATAAALKAAGGSTLQEQVTAAKNAATTVATKAGLSAKEVEEEVLAAELAAAGATSLDVAMLVTLRHHSTTEFDGIARAKVVHGVAMALAVSRDTVVVLNIKSLGSAPTKRSKKKVGVRSRKLDHRKQTGTSLVEETKGRRLLASTAAVAPTTHTTIGVNINVRILVHDNATLASRVSSALAAADFEATLVRMLVKAGLGIAAGDITVKNGNAAAEDATASAGDTDAHLPDLSGNSAAAAVVFIVLLVLGLAGIAAAVVMNKRKMAAAGGYDKVEINEESPIAKNDFSWGAGQGAIVTKTDAPSDDNQFQVRSSL
jgi:hypothetical protein